MCSVPGPQSTVTGLSSLPWGPKLVPHKHLPCPGPHLRYIRCGPSPALCSADAQVLTRHLSVSLVPWFTTLPLSDSHQLSAGTVIVTEAGVTMDSCTVLPWSSCSLLFNWAEIFCLVRLEIAKRKNITCYAILPYTECNTRKMVIIVQLLSSS